MKIVNETLFRPFQTFNSWLGMGMECVGDLGHTVQESADSSCSPPSPEIEHVWMSLRRPVSRPVPGNSTKPGAVTHDGAPRTVHLVRNIFEVFTPVEKC